MPNDRGGTTQRAPGPAGRARGLSSASELSSDCGEAGCWSTCIFAGMRSVEACSASTIAATLFEAFLLVAFLLRAMRQTR